MSNQRLSDAIEEFGAYIKSAYAPGSAKQLRHTADRLLTEIGNIWVKNITPRHVDDFLVAMTTTGVSAATMNNHVSRLRVFFDFCRRRRWAPTMWDPVGHRRRLKGVPGKKLRIPADRFEELLDSADNLRDRVAWAVGLYLLLRRSEMMSLRVGDVHLDRGEVDVVVWKTAQRDVMPISTELDIELRNWLATYAEYMQQPLKAEWKLIPSRPAGSHNRRDPQTGRLLPWTGPLKLVPENAPTNLDLCLKRTLQRMGYEDMGGVGLHTLRRSGARARFDVLQEQGYDGALRQVAALLHHSTTANTENYLGLELDVKNRDEAIRGNIMYGVKPKAQPRRWLRAVEGGK